MAGAASVAEPSLGWSGLCPLGAKFARASAGLPSRASARQRCPWLAPTAPEQLLPYSLPHPSLAGGRTRRPRCYTVEAEPSSEVQGAARPGPWRLAADLPAPACGRQAATASRSLGLTVLPEQCFLAGPLATSGDILVVSMRVPLTTMSGGQGCCQTPFCAQGGPTH